MDWSAGLFFIKMFETVNFYFKTEWLSFILNLNGISFCWFFNLFIFFLSFFFNYDFNYDFYDGEFSISVKIVQPNRPEPKS